MLARVRTDPEYYAALGNGWLTRMDDPEWPRGFFLPGYPQVVQLWRTPKGGEDRVPMNKSWLLFERAMNQKAESPTNAGHPHKWAEIAYCTYNKQPPFRNYILSAKIPDGFKAYHENIVFGNQIVNVLERKNGSSRIETLYFKDSPPSQSVVNHVKTPWLVHQVTAIYRDGTVGYNPDYSVVISKEEGGVWLPDERLDFNMNEPAPPAELQVTNQDVINMLYDGFQAEGVPGSEVWNYIVALGLEHLVADRDKVIEL